MQRWQTLCNGLTMSHWIHNFFMRHSAKSVLSASLWTFIGIAGLISAFFQPRPTPQHASTHIQMTILRCHDGDTCTGEDERHHLWTLRFAGIDAPEMGQPPQSLSQKSKNRLEALILNNLCDVEILSKDAYGRHLALVRHDGVLSNQVMVQEGLAYAYVNLNFKDSYFRWATQAETIARKNKRGLFSLREIPLSPHEFRVNKKDGALQTKKRTPENVWQR